MVQRGHSQDTGVSERSNQIIIRINSSTCKYSLDVWQQKRHQHEHLLRMLLCSNQLRSLSSVQRLNVEIALIWSLESAPWPPTWGERLLSDRANLTYAKTSPTFWSLSRPTASSSCLVRALNNVEVSSLFHSLTEKTENYVGGHLHRAVNVLFHWMT